MSLPPSSSNLLIFRDELAVLIILGHRGLEVPEFALGVLWDEKFECEGQDDTHWDLGGRRKDFGKGKEGWKVERRERKGEEGNLWEREWGYLVDLGMSG